MDIEKEKGREKRKLATGQQSSTRKGATESWTEREKRKVVGKTT